jgi:hypothetical protein
MFKIILTIITLALIVTSCNHNKRNGTNHHFEPEYRPDYGYNDDDLIIDETPISLEIPEPSFLFSYALFSVSYVMIRKK